MRVGRQQRVADRVVEGVDRSVALPHDPLAVALGGQPHRALGVGLLLAVGVVCRLGEDAPGLHREVLRQLVELPTKQQLETRVRRLVGVARCFRVLHPVGDPSRKLAVGQVESQLLTLDLDVGPTRHVGDEHAHVVADQGGINVLVEVGIDFDRAGVQPRLVGERRQTNIRLTSAGWCVRHLGDLVREAGGLAQVAGRKQRPAVLELQVGDRPRSARRCRSARRSR